MRQRCFLKVYLSGLLLGACAMPVEGEGTESGDLKPADAAELAGADIGTSQSAHTLHYTDGTNQWGETRYPMGTTNFDCQDWWVYDLYSSNRPALGWTKVSTYLTSHPWARGTYVDSMMATLPGALGYTAASRQQLIDHNTEVARPSGKCSGRYVFQFDNRTFASDTQPASTYAANSYYFSANIPENIDPANQAACEARGADAVAATLMDLYVCEAPAYQVKTVGFEGPNNWCSRERNNWRRAGSSVTQGTWSAGSCNTAATQSYTPPSGKIAVSFNIVVKAGIGHGVAPADLWIYRYN